MNYQIYETQMKDLETLAEDMMETCFNSIDDSQITSIMMHSYAGRLNLILNKINRTNVLITNSRARELASLKQ